MDLENGRYLYVSGFGRAAFFEDKTYSLYCWTNQHGPSIYKPCQTRCLKNDPPTSRNERCKKFSQQFNFTEENENHGFNVKIEDDNDLCFFKPGDFGWCLTSQNGDWGYCSYHCSLSEKVPYPSQPSTKLMTAPLRKVFDNKSGKVSKKKINGIFH